MNTSILCNTTRHEHIYNLRVVAESSKLSQVGCADEQWFKRIPLALFKLELSRKSAAHA